MNRGVRLLRNPTAWLLLGCLGWSMPALAQQQGVLHVFTTRVAALGQEAVGLACWLGLPDGSWRAVLSSEARSCNDLLAENGEGWTVIAGGGRTGWLNRWRGPSRKLRPAENQLAHALADQLRRGKRASPRRLCVESVHDEQDLLGTEPGALSADGESTDYNSGGRTELRLRLAHRARGSGAAEENLWVAWREVPDLEDVSELVVTSRRRIGSLKLRPFQERKITYDELDVLTPIWPLLELIRIDRNP